MSKTKTEVASKVKGMSFTTQAAALMLLSSAITLVAAMLSWVPKGYALSLIVYLPLAYFIYKRKRWSIIASMVIFNLDKLVQVGTTDIQGGMAKVVLFWWIFYMVVFYQALKEVNEEKRVLSKRLPAIENPSMLSSPNSRSSGKFALLKWVSIIFLSLIVIFSVLFYQRKMKVAECVVNFTNQRTIIPIEYTSLTCNDERMAGQSSCRSNSNRPSRQDLYRLYCEDTFKLW